MEVQRMFVFSLTYLLDHSFIFTKISYVAFAVVSTFVVDVCVLDSIGWQFQMEVFFSTWCL